MGPHKVHEHLQYAIGPSLAIKKPKLEESLLTLVNFLSSSSVLHLKTYTVPSKLLQLIRQCICSYGGGRSAITCRKIDKESVSLILEVEKIDAAK